jgi:hypothetical protein
VGKVRIAPHNGALCHNGAVSINSVRAPALNQWREKFNRWNNKSRQGFARPGCESAGGGGAATIRSSLMSFLINSPAHYRLAFYCIHQNAFAPVWNLLLITQTLIWAASTHIAAARSCKLFLGADSKPLAWWMTTRSSNPLISKLSLYLPFRCSVKFCAHKFHFTASRLPGLHQPVAPAIQIQFRNLFNSLGSKADALLSVRHLSDMRCIWKYSPKV